MTIELNTTNEAILCDSVVWRKNGDCQPAPHRTAVIDGEEIAFSARWLWRWRNRYRLVCDVNGVPEAFTARRNWEV